MMTLGEKIKLQREARDISQQELADAICVNSSMVISNWELNKSKPDTEKMIQICIVLGVPLEYFYAEAKQLYSIQGNEPGERLETLIDNKDIKHRVFAEKSGVTANTLSKFLSGRSPMTDKYIKKAAEILGTSYEYIKYGVDVSSLDTPGKRLKDALSRSGYKHKDFANDLGIYYTTLSRYLNDKVTIPESFMVKASEALDLPIAYIKDGKLLGVNLPQYGSKDEKYYRAIEERLSDIEDMITEIAKHFS